MGDLGDDSVAKRFADARHGLLSNERPRGDMFQLRVTAAKECSYDFIA